jgi:hypothetical protein
MSSVLGRLRLVGGLAGAVVVALLAIAAAMAGAQNDAVRAREFLGRWSFAASPVVAPWEWERSRPARLAGSWPRTRRSC